MRTALCLIFLLLLSFPAYAAVYFIPDDYGSIQEAINASADGDVIKVSPGTYYENVNFLGKSLVLQSVQGAEQTFINGSWGGSVITCNGVESVLEGFTILDGGSYISYGGGMYNNNSSLTVIQCIFLGNWARDGGGMYNLNSSVYLFQCRFYENGAEDYGGGISNSNSTTTMIQCYFGYNEAFHEGGAIYNLSCSPTITQCTFYMNFASEGAGMYNHHSSPVVTQCTFYANYATDKGDGMFNYNSSPLVTNCILWDGWYEIHNVGSSNPAITYSCIAEGYPGAGNIDSNPLLSFNVDSTFHLMINSPCIDAGDNNASNLPIYDFEGDARIKDGNGDGIAVVDMGVDEWSPCPEIWVDDDWSGLGYGSPVGGGHIFGLDAIDKIQDGIDAVTTGGTVHVADGTYTGERNRDNDFSGRAITVKSDNGPDACIIDCEQLGRGFQFHSGEGSDSLLEGFTIYNGSGGQYGGGVFIEVASPTVANCIFQENRAIVGGGMCILYEPSYPTVIGCRFQENSVDQVGGGMCNGYGGSSRVIDCTFLENASVFSGGGMCNYTDSSPEVIQCTFHGNTAINGGGICNYDNCSPTMIQCTFHGNTAYEGDGGGMFNYLSEPTVTNCVFWGDTPYEIDDSIGSPVITYSCIQGGYPGSGNIDADPLFIDPANYDLHLSAASPCIDAGDNDALGIPAKDFEGDPRCFPGNGKGFRLNAPPQGAVVDMGVDEYCLMKQIVLW